MILPRAGPDDLGQLGVQARRPPLEADLDDAVVLPRRLDHPPALTDGRGERLLGVDVLPGGAGGRHMDRVPVVGSGDDHGVDVLAVEQAAEVLHPLRRPAEVGLSRGDALALVLEGARSRWAAVGAAQGLPLLSPTPEVTARPASGSPRRCPGWSVAPQTGSATAPRRLVVPRPPGGDRGRLAGHPGQPAGVPPSPVSRSPDAGPRSPSLTAAGATRPSNLPASLENVI